MTTESTAASRAHRIPVVGILGGIGSGKSSVVRSVAGLRLHMIDADKIGHDLLAKPSIQAELTQYFGSDIFAADKSVDRSRLGARVFGPTAEHQAALNQLNNILHPAIRREIHAQIDGAPQDADAIILDAALLLEGGWDVTCDWLIFIDTPQHLREERVLHTRGWVADELQRREAAQWPIAAKRDRADFTVDNSTTIAAAASQMAAVFESILNASDSTQS